MSQSGKNFKRTRYACYFSYLASAPVFSLPPMLFATFREMYGISYTLLGTLVLVNFCTQLAIDLIFTFFSNHFNIHKTIRTMPLLTSLGLLIYAITPMVFPKYAFTGLLVGTVTFSVAAGLGEVLISPTIAALPSDNPERDMSLLHSLYAWGVVSVIIISTVFFKIFGTEKWIFLTLFLAILPIISSIMYHISPLPEMNFSNTSADSEKRKNFGLLLCALCIFLGGAAENAMTNWISVYMENALQIPKALGDILGMAVFAVLLGLGRILYAKHGRSIENTLLFGMCGTTLCYLTAVFCPIPLISALACILVGLCTSMLWPGTLIFMEDKFPNAGVTAYALMAAGGDFGSSVAPQLLGAVVDTVSDSSIGIRISTALSITTEQIGMKAGMLTATLFPLIGIALLIYIKKHFKKHTI